MTPAVCTTMPYNGLFVKAFFDFDAELPLLCYNVFTLEDRRQDRDALAMTRNTANLSHLLILIFYLLLALALTWPLGAYLTTHIPGTAVWAFDESTFVWNMWWFKFGLLTLGDSPLHTDYIFYPARGLTWYSIPSTFSTPCLACRSPCWLPCRWPSNLVLLFAYV